MTGLGWLYERDMPLISLTFARDVTPAELLLRMGGDPETFAWRGWPEFDAEFGDLPGVDHTNVVTAGVHGPWAWACEESSWQCIADRDLVCRVSVGTAALVLHANEKPMVEFRYAEDGRLVTGINTLGPWGTTDREGDDPCRFDAELRALGADPDTGDEGAQSRRILFYRLAETLGVGRPRPRDDSGPVFAGRLPPPWSDRALPAF